MTGNGTMTTFLSKMRVQIKKTAYKRRNKQLRCSRKKIQCRYMYFLMFNSEEILRVAVNPKVLSSKGFV